MDTRPPITDPSRQGHFSLPLGMLLLIVGLGACASDPPAESAGDPGAPNTLSTDEPQGAGESDSAQAPETSPDSSSVATPAEDASAAPRGDDSASSPRAPTDAGVAVDEPEVADEATPDGDSASKADAEDATASGPTDPCEGHQLASATWVDVSAPSSWVTHQDRVPFNIHMTWQDDVSTTMTLQWATALADLELYTPKVWIAPLEQVTGDADAQAMRWSEAGVWTGTGEVYRESLLGQVLGETDWVTWTVSLGCLSPNTTYAYRVGSWESFDPDTGVFVDPNLSEIGTFTTGPPAGEDLPFEVLFAGDSRGGTDKIRQYIEGLTELPSAFWCFNGDMSNGGTQPEWSDWMDSMGPLLASRPLMGVQGNHEVFANVYYAQFAFPIMPGLEPEFVEHAWAFTYGNAHFIGLDSNTEDAVIAQVPWLEAHLAQVQADPDIDWIFAMMHHAPYSACTVHGSTERLQTHWSPLFEAYGVDIVFSGHDHNYERTHPVANHEVASVDDGVVYVVAGAFGAPAYQNGNDWWTAVSVHGEVGNYVRVQIDGKQLELTAYSMDGTEVLDTHTMTK